jgi:hypothetical protein
MVCNFGEDQWTFRAGLFVGAVIGLGIFSIVLTFLTVFSL